MRYNQPLKQILTSARNLWDRDETRPAVRENFNKVALCRTPALGAERYASETEEKLVYHTCKSKSCPSCGHRATVQWQREQWAALPDVPYTGVCFTMPNVLWPSRYVRRPPIAQHRFIEITDQDVVFWAKDLRLKKRVETRYSITEFVATLADHVPDRYCHAIRYFGLLAPSSKRKTSAALFALLGQAQRHRPQRLSWAYSLQKHFGFDPLNCALSLRGSWKANGGLPVKSDSSPHACLAIN